MSDKLTCCPIDKLLRWILVEEKEDRVFGICKDLYFTPGKHDVFKMTRYGQVLETPIGVAAGPHTQMAQNIIASWLTGARYIELKTVQTLDELDVPKPCIDMQDEGYNCEWSQELSLDQSFNEYLNAFILLHILKNRYGWGDPNTAGFIFNMSLGYSLEGILKPNVQAFLDRMTDCREEKAVKIKSLAEIYPGVKDIRIPDLVSNNITISTMHGCPPDEVERIARYFIEERRVHTAVKLNPTLLGPERVRHILNEKLGFEIQVPDEAFEHDLTYDAGVNLIASLLSSAEKAGVTFSLKLTNTLEVLNPKRALPLTERMLYMSGRSLHPISITLARRLQNEFKGKLDISFSAGTDCFNISEVLACNLAPVTVCSDLLKPGGYGRLSQYLERIDEDFSAVGARTIQAFMMAKSKGTKDHRDAGLENLKAYARDVVDKEIFHKSHFPYENIKTSRPLTRFDCVQAPCMITCPLSQNIPGYMYYAAKGEYEKAYRIIVETNPFPNVQGMACDHLCQTKCTRINYDTPVLIREIKRFIAQKHGDGPGIEPAPPNGLKVAVIGGGPSGLSCAYFLALEGFSVDIYEGKEFVGGMAADGIPSFRLDDASIQRDIRDILAVGVNIHCGKAIDRNWFDELNESHDFIYIAVGAQKPVKLNIPGEDAEGIIDQLDFLSAVRRDSPPALGKRVVVFGGGNSTVDAARTAKRLVEQDGEVTIVYRRTRKEMPAGQEEVQAAIAEGIHLIELTAPERLLVKDGRITSSVCAKMALGERDASGRPKPIRIQGSEFELQVDTVITAIGQQVVLDFFPEPGLKVDPVTNETQLHRVFAGGDALRGASTLVKAIGDAKRAAEHIKRLIPSDARVPVGDSKPKQDFAILKKKQARRQYGPMVPETPAAQRTGFGLTTLTLDEKSARAEAERCLSCDILCDVCVTVCPNRANVSYRLKPVEFTAQQIKRSDSGIAVMGVGTVRFQQPFQILNIGDFCNECGNCTTFCPTSGSPYLVKPKFYLSKEAFEQEDNCYFLKNDVLRARIHGKAETLTLKRGFLIYETKEVWVRLHGDTLGVEECRFKSKTTDLIDMRHAAEMGVMLRALKGFYLFR
jgi:putative selenate reductase